MNVQILGKSYPLAYTIDAQCQIDEKVSGIENIEVLFDESDPVTLLKNVVFLVSILMKAAADRERLKNKLMGNDAETVVVPTYEELLQVVEVKEIKTLMEAAMKTIQEGSQVTTEVEESEKKTETESK